jgi:antitoxin (DNA-binding transcriptional repressor) of toxin-antitoxin stability system
MTTMTLDEFVRNIESVMERLEHGGEEIVLTRGERAVARIVPEGPKNMRTYEALSGLVGILPPGEGEAWLEDMQGFDRPASGEVRDPWE